MILSLLTLWFALFLFFGILYVEVFGLTRWESAETHDQNYFSLGSALVMLAFMSTGYEFNASVIHLNRHIICTFDSEGWNQYMHDL